MYSATSAEFIGDCNRCASFLSITQILSTLQLGFGPVLAGISSKLDQRSLLSSASQSRKQQNPASIRARIEKDASVWLSCRRDRQQFLVIKSTYKRATSTSYQCLTTRIERRTDSYCTTLSSRTQSVNSNQSQARLHAYGTLYPMFVRL